MAASGKQLKCYDDFIADPYDVEFRPWDQDKVPDLVYLHGALNIFRHDRRLAMLRYRLGARLVDQINDRLRANEFPVLVAEGSSLQKADRIDANPYLAKAFDTYRRALNDPTSVLFTFGHSLNAVDAHLLRVLGRRKLRGIYIGAFGGVDSADGARAQRWASEWQEKRPGLDVAVYDSRECAVWKAGLTPPAHGGGVLHQG
jgi:pimeloyl-ACP methyl ester carboxylesterase